MAVQVLAEKLEMDPKDISVGYADSDKGFNSSGPGGSRFTVMIAGAVSGAADVIREKMLRVASHMLEADPSDLEFRAGKIGVQGVPGKEKTLAEVALHAHYFRLSMPEDHDLTSGIDAAYVYDHPVTTMPSEDRTDLGIFYPIVGHMVHIPVVEVDIETGKVGFLDYVAVHDCGTMVNPMTLAGHVRGGTVNGIGSALYEHFNYDENGQLQNVLLSDYLHPTLMETPVDIRVGHVETPSPFTEYGIKGGGEGGRMGAPPAIAAAIEDALKPFGIKVDSLPLTPKALRAMIREAEANAA